MADLTCPFCNETEFDAIGLKQHLQRGWCDAFNETPTTDRPAPVAPFGISGQPISTAGVEGRKP